MADSGDDGDGLKSLLDSAQRALRRAEVKGDHKAVLECLRLLGELRKRGRIAASAASAPSGRASVEPHGQKRDPQGFDQRLREIYHLTGPGWDAAIAQREADAKRTPDERLIASLGELVERTADGKIAAACTLAASLISGRPLDAESKAEVRRLLLDEGEHDEIGNMVEEPDEAAAEAEEGDAEKAEAESAAPSDDRDDSRSGDGIL